MKMHSGVLIALFAVLFLTACDDKDPVYTPTSPTVQPPDMGVLFLSPASVSVVDTPGGVSQKFEVVGQFRGTSPWKWEIFEAKTPSQITNLGNTIAGPEKVVTVQGIGTYTIIATSLGEPRTGRATMEVRGLSEFKSFSFPRYTGPTTNPKTYRFTFEAQTRAGYYEVRMHITTPSSTTMLHPIVFQPDRNQGSTLIPVAGTQKIEGVRGGTDVVVRVPVPAGAQATGLSVTSRSTSDVSGVSLLISNFVPQ